MKINHNIQALNAYRNLAQTMGQTSKTLEKLSSGMRINRAADDAAGLAISEKMRSQIRGLDMAERNSMDGISLIQTAEGALSSTHQILQRMRELAVQAANDTLEDQDREAIQSEINQLTSEINRIGNATEFNKKKLLNDQISPESRSVEVTEGTFNKGTTTILEESVKLKGKSELIPGDYKVRIEESYTNKVTPSYVAGGISTVSIDPENTSLPEGTYRVDVIEETVKTIENTPTSNSAIDSISIAPNSPLPNGDVTLQFKKENSVGTIQDPDITGITNVQINTNANVSEADSFQINVKSSPTSIQVGDAGGPFITNLQINSTTFQNTGNGYQLKFDEPVAGEYTVTLVSNDGTTPLSEPVRLDDNIQTYEFWNGGSKIGVSFETVNNINTAIGAGNDGKYNEFNINKELELVKNGSVIGSQQLTDGTPSGDVTITGTDGNDYTISHTGFAGTDINKSATFDINSELSFSTNNFTTSEIFTEGDQITLDGGIFVNTSADLANYNGIPTTDVVISVGQSNGYTAQLIDDRGNPVSNSAKMVVNNNGSYSFGEPTNISFTTSTLTTGNFEFEVGKTTVKNAVLETVGQDIETIKGLKTDSVLSFADGELTMDIGDLTNGIAQFTIGGGTVDQSLQLQIGANEGQTLKLGIKDMRAEALNLTRTSPGETLTLTNREGKEVIVHFTTTGNVTNGSANEFAIDLTTSEHAAAAILAFDQAISNISFERANLGAIQNRLEHTITNLQITNENLTSAESRIRDTDMAKSMTEYTKNNILNQAGQAMLAQANQLPQGILQLLK